MPFRKNYFFCNYVYIFKKNVPTAIHLNLEFQLYFIPFPFFIQFLIYVHILYKIFFIFLDSTINIHFSYFWIIRCRRYRHNYKYLKHTTSNYFQKTCGHIVNVHCLSPCGKLLMQLTVREDTHKKNRGFLVVEPLRSEYHPGS